MSTKTGVARSIKNAVGGGDERERRGDDFIAGTDAHGAHDEVKGCRTVDAGDRVPGAAMDGEGFLELGDGWAQAQVWGAQDRDDGVDLGLRDVRSG